jgi:hypothetical protein
MSDEQLDLFDDAFDKLVIGDESPFDKKVDEKPCDPVVEEKPAETPDGDVPDGDVPAAAVPDEQPAPVEKAPEKPAPVTSDDDVLARLANLVKKTDTQQAPAEQPKPEPEVNPFTPEEQDFLKTYENDWSDVSRAEEIKRRVEYQGLTRYIFDQVAQAMAPLEQAVQQLMSQARLGGVKAAVSDYDTLKPKLDAWIEKQPTYLQSAYKHVIQSGSAEDVADLVARYKKEAGGPAPTSTRKPVAELPTPAKQAVEALAPVSSERSAPASHEPDLNDFDSAFERAVAALK